MKIKLIKWSDGRISASTGSIIIKHGDADVAQTKTIEVDDAHGEDYMKNPEDYDVNFDSGELIKGH